MLDAGPLGLLAHPKPRADVVAWAEGLIAAGVRLIVPEVTDYEVRRNLILSGLPASVAALDHLGSVLVYAPLTTSVMRRAAGLWADARRRGRPTADPKELDGDVILAAQAIEFGAVVATTNVGHLARFVTAKDWPLITP